MKEKLKDLMRFFFPDGAEPGAGAPAIDTESVITDLRIFLVQLSRRITDHLEYEHRIGQGLPHDTGLILRFRLDDYVTDLVEFFEIKHLLRGSEETLFLAAIEVLLPPENVRDQLPWRIRRQLFTTLLTRIADYTQIPYPRLTRSFYDHLARRDSVNGIPRNDVLEVYHEAMTELSRDQDRKTHGAATDDTAAGDAAADTATGNAAADHTAADDAADPLRSGTDHVFPGDEAPRDEAPPQDETFSHEEESPRHDSDRYQHGAAAETEVRLMETPELIRKTLAACGATNFTKLKKILVRRHVFDLVSVAIVYTVVVAAAIIFENRIRAFLQEYSGISIDTVAWYIVVVIVYVLLVTVRFQVYRYRATRRRTLIRVSNALAETVGISYKELDDVLHETYGTTLRELKSALLPRSRR